ncbi:MAG: hypothetical protein SFU85_13870 [Candidatus Methylacidiphilales bacterium]|nr:hypothetical protein [Candidatus Methylacidiphilales bacterium]
MLFNTLMKLPMSVFLVLALTFATSSILEAGSTIVGSPSPQSPAVSEALAECQAKCDCLGKDLETAKAEIARLTALLAEKDARILALEEENTRLKQPQPPAPAAEPAKPPFPAWLPWLLIVIAAIIGFVIGRGSAGGTGSTK